MYANHLTVVGTEAALVLGSGMAAVTSTLLTLLKAGDHMLIQEAAYGGTFDLVHKEFKDLNITATMIDTSQPSNSWASLLMPNTKVIYVEAISNPLMQVPDLPVVVAFAQQHKLTSVIDATFATPVNLQPAVSPGFDVVIHSATKFLNGHSDIIAGAVAGRSKVISKITGKANHLGGSLDPHAAFLLQRGIKTLALRVERQNANAAALAAALEKHPQVQRVHYPGLQSHERYQLVRELFRKGGAGGMLSFETVGGMQQAEAVVRGLQLGLVAPSLGGVETLVTLPATTSHSGLTAEQRAAIGINDNLIRVAVGIEDTEDLVDDFMRALDATAAEVAANGSAAN
eukprot:GHRR01022936.1.p1 GENE.GHRR01022936.1~~GHRR01022936.1.p1  ORF type:complete len:343 (+),score=118.12 GHRR01022936.1:395-1423(+)